jgi:hypothetical protein
MNRKCTLVAVSALALAGCSSGDGAAKGSGDAPANRATAPAQQTKVDRAATIARAIQANPDNADEVLRQNGMSEQQFDDLLYEIAADPAMSAEYNAKVRP